MSGTVMLNVVASACRVESGKQIWPKPMLVFIKADSANDAKMVQKNILQVIT
jgi:hypothetical protein